MGLSNFADIQRIESLPLGKALSTDLHDCLQKFMEPQSWQSLAAIAIIVGPGSYTGSRIGVVTARTLAQSLNIPIYGFSSLAIAATISCHEAGKVAIAIPAQRNHVYGAIYQIEKAKDEPITLLAEKNLNHANWLQVIEETPGLQESIKFEYNEITSGQMVEKLLVLGQNKLKKKVMGNWQEIFPNYAKS